MFSNLGSILPHKKIRDTNIYTKFETCRTCFDLSEIKSTYSTKLTVNEERTNFHELTSLCHESNGVLVLNGHEVSFLAKLINHSIND